MVGDEVFGYLAGIRPQLREVRRITTFEAIRGDGVDAEEIRVTIHEGGLMSPDGRRWYKCYVEREDGEVFTGNSRDSVAGAISAVHWEDLDA